MVSITFMVNFYYIYGWYYIYGFYYIYGWYKAHCISQWGLPGLRSKQAAVPVRVWYGNLGELKSLTASDLPSIMLTATTSPSTNQRLCEPTREFDEPM